ncbi:hypothetical protein PRIPAC_79163 [Pristionchus pacificus]|uniref:alkaline phosphatase n=1 Tax=Pristionchus pacificus TaxID=54126 RepID=A0A2A6CBC7_PRIPA|nr:hypothetical protein PRIPAC_79163 [Pristionchus pacificus]|eukprot:PDM75378.1 hypothetical protein PRIPAC_42555 [Pristionchus pacificus]
MRLSTLLAVLSTAIAVHAQYQQSQIEFWNALGTEHLQQKLRWKAPGDKGPKNVIFFLGDGMGLSMVTSGRVITAEKTGRDYRNEKWAFEKFDFSGILKTSSYDYHTTDSAAGAMALFTGHKVEQNTLGRLPGFGEKCDKGDASHINDGIAELAIARGLDVGVVSTTRLTDATPAANFAKGVHRLMEHDSSTEIKNTNCTDIAQQILRHPADKFKVLMGGGHAFFTPTEEDGLRTDGRNIEKEWQALPGRRTILRTVDDIHAHAVNNDDQVLGVFHDKSFNYHLDELVNKTSQPRLVDMSVKALEILQKSNNENGFYLMIEGGHIDLAEHENKMNLATEELAEFSHTIETIRGMVGEDTLIVVTADHGHALTLPGYVHKHNSILAAEVETDGMDADGLPIPNILFAAGTSSTNRANMTDYDQKQAHFQSVAAFPAKWGAHGGEDLGIWTQGPYSWLFSGSMENTQVAYLIKFLLCLDHKEPTLCGMRKEEGGGNYATGPVSAALHNDAVLKAWCVV